MRESPGFRQRKYTGRACHSQPHPVLDSRASSSVLPVCYSKALPMDNKAIANILYETADLLEIDAQDSFRIRSYRNAAQAIENHSEQITDVIAEPKNVLAIAGIGK